MSIASALALLILTAPPAATPLANPLALRLAIDAQREHACSRSFASTHDTATLGLDVNLRGVAILTFAHRSLEVFGPSPSRYRDGDHEFTRTTRAHHIVWQGRAVARGDDFTITFETALASEAIWRGEGELPLPAPTSSPAAWTLTCSDVARTVHPAQHPPSAQLSPADTQAAAPLTVTNCTSSALPELLTRLAPNVAHDGLPFAPGRGLVLTVSARWGDELSILRRAD